MEILIPAHISKEISNRCLRCYNEQYWYGKNFLFDYMVEHSIAGKNVLEIGCAEAGLLKFFSSKGAECFGMELSDVRFKNATLLNETNSDKFHLFQANICVPETYKTFLKEKFDFIIIRDVIEHIPEKEIALKNIYSLLKEGGKLFMSFPPKHCPYAGHQQTAPKVLAKLPYLHLLPNIIYRYYLAFIGCNNNKIDYLIRTKETRISIRNMKILINKIGFKITKESNWFIRPAYAFRFGIPKLKNPLSIIPLFNELFCNGILFLVIKQDK